MQHPKAIAIDFAAVGTIIGVLAGYLPAIATLFAIAWYIALFVDRARRNKKERERDSK